MANKKISELQSRTPALSDLMLVGDPSSGYSYKCTVTALATIIETDIADGFVTIGTTQTVSGAKTFSNNLTLTSVVNTPTDPDKFLTLNASNVVTYRTGAEVLSDIGGQGALTLTTSGSSGAATLVGNNLNIPNYGSALSGYVPYTGATTNVNLASRYLQANYLVVDGQSNATAINFKQYSSVSFLGDGYTGMGSVSVDKMFFNFAQGSNIFKTFYFDASAITGNATRAYIMPNADGTLALTSQIPTVSGTTNYVAKFTSSSAVGNSQIFDNGTNVGIGNASPAYKLDVSGSIYGTNIIGSTSLNVSSGNGLFLNNTGNTNYYTLYTNSSNVFNIGFGSTTPIVSINSSGNITANSFIKSGGTSSQYLMADGSTSTLTNPVTGTGTTNYIPKFTSSSAIGNSIVQDYGDNVWVGSNTAGYGTLNIQRFTSAPYATLTLTDQATSSNEVGIYLRANGSNPVGISSAGAPIAFYTGGPASNERMRLTSGGNLGIGTSAPDRKLVIQGAFNSNEQLLYLKQGDNNGFSFNLDAAVTGNLMIKGVNSGTETSSLLTIRRDNGNTGIGTSAPAEKLDVYDNSASNVSIKVGNTSGALQLLQGNGAAYLYTATNQPLIFSNNNSEKMRLDASGNLYLNTTSGTGRLVIAQSNATQPAITLTTDESTIQGPSANTKILMGGNLSMYGANILTFGTGTTERARIDASGNLGLGTTSTSAISGGYTGLFINGSSGSNIDFRAGETGYGRVQADVNGLLFAGLNSVPITFFTGGTERMRISSTGNVSIGNTNNTYKLDVSGEGKFRTGEDGIDIGVPAGNSYRSNIILRGTNASGTSSISYLGINVFSTDGSIDITSSNSAIFRTGGSTERMRLDASGRLGIGTSTPSQALDVLGMVNIGRNQNSNVTNLNINSGSTPVSAFQISTDQPNLLAYINSRNSYDLGLFTNDVERLRISSTGNVGIGTATPSYKLEIYNAGGASAVIGGATGKIYVYGDDSGGTVGTLSSIPLRFATNGTERMRITSSGSVGIGTTSPNIDGGTATALTINSAASGGRLELASGGTRYAQYFAGSSAAYLTTYTSIPLVFETNASERMRITSGGNVGIGSSNPQEKFVVSNGSSLNIEINPSYIQSFNRTSATYNDLSFFSSTFIVNTGTSPTERMRITSGGELLINTTSDAGDYKLQVNGNVYAGGQLRIETSSSPAINIVKNATVDNRYIRFTNSEASSKDWDIINRPNANSNELAFYNNTDGVFALKLGTTGNGEFAGSIKTAAPSGGTAKPWKLGEAGVTLGGSNTSGVRVEIDGTVYYLVTGYLP